MTIGEQIKNARKAAGLTQGDFSKLLGTSQAVVCLWETDKKMPRKKFREKISSELNISLDIQQQKPFIDSEIEMTFRDEIAVSVMLSMLKTNPIYTDEGLAKAAYQIADAMMKERSK